MRYRQATVADASAIAALHTLSWQLNYRNSMSDQYLDHEAPAERASFWKTRLTSHPHETQTLIARDGGKLTGFCCLETDAHPEHGYYLDNLHVAPEVKGKGVGKALMQKSADLLLKKRTDGTIYLWVLTANQGAIGFYDHLRAERGEVKTMTLAGKQLEVLKMRWRLSEMANW